ncbi:TolC family protein [Aminipila butyrica]|uniref:TolC family protein n=1 Tax=Aminipila butyrica TaxID=433296 RepID=A0A858BRI4_9FIRM|nr:TolC family protein [Aminipila butyrica]QIB68157.1 TolC family protein [Aminipila butyrica]
MKKQLFIALLATTLMVTTIPATALTAANTVTNTVPAVTAPTTTSTGAITKTTTSDAASKTTDSAIESTTTESTSSDPTTQKATATTDSGITTDSTKAQPPETTTTSTTESLAPATLSLEGAYKKMLSDSPQAILAKYTMDSELSVAKGYSEKISSINKTERAAKDPSLSESDRLAASWSIDTANKIMLQAQKDFGKTQAPKNYEASINQLKSDTYEKYYNYKYTEAQVQVAKDNLTRTQEVYNSTMLKYKLGNVSRLDTLTAETALNAAKDDYAVKVNEFETEKMNFNLFMGYGIHQKITLTDSLAPLAFPTKSLEDSVKEAKSNRNEVSEANYNVQMAQHAMNDVKAYPSSSATYISAKTVLQMAQEVAKTKPESIEVDVRTKYMDMKQKYDAISSGKVSYENSKEASRLSQLQYDSGLITVTELSETNLKTFETQQAYYKTILDYNLAVDVYVLSSGIGTKTASIN